MTGPEVGNSPEHCVPSTDQGGAKSLVVDVEEVGLRKRRLALVIRERATKMKVRSGKFGLGLQGIRNDLLDRTAEDFRHAEVKSLTGIGDRAGADASVRGPKLDIDHLIHF